MKVLKFVTGGGGVQPEIYYFTAGIRLAGTMGFKEYYRANHIAALGVRAIMGSSYLHEHSAGLGFKSIIGWSEIFTVALGLSVEEFEVGWATLVETLGLHEALQNTRTISVSFTEGLALVESGNTSLGPLDFLVTWRTRTKAQMVGYGKAGYAADGTGYGSGSAPEVAAFRVKVYDITGNILRRNVIIPIGDRVNPDADASFNYTGDLNFLDHNYFESNLRFEIYQIEDDGSESPPASIDVTPVPHV